MARLTGLLLFALLAGCTPAWCQTSAGALLSASASAHAKLSDANAALSALGALLASSDATLLRGNVSIVAAAAGVAVQLSALTSAAPSVQAALDALTGAPVVGA